MRRLLLLALIMAACSAPQAPPPADPAEAQVPVRLCLPGGRLTVLAFAAPLSQAQAGLVAAALAQGIASRYRLHTAAGPQLQEELFGGAAQAAPERCLVAFAGLVDEGRKSLDRFQLTAAGERLAQAQQMLATCGAFVERDRLLDLMLAVGRYFTVRNQQVEAVSAFRQAVIFSPELSPGASGLTGKALESFDEARRAVRSGNRHRLTVETRPPGALVFLDGKAQGEAPLSLELYSGLHYLRAELSGFGTATAVLPDAVPPEKVELRLADIERSRQLAGLRAELQKPAPAPEAAAYLKKLCADLQTDGVLFLFFERQGEVLDAVIRIFSAAHALFDYPQRFTLGSNEKAWQATTRGLAGLLSQLRDTSCPLPVEEPPAPPPDHSSSLQPSPAQPQLEAQPEQDQQRQEQPVKQPGKKKSKKKKKKN